MPGIFEVCLHRQKREGGVLAQGNGKARMALRTIGSPGKEARTALRTGRMKRSCFMFSLFRDRDRGLRRCCVINSRLGGVRNSGFGIVIWDSSSPVKNLRVTTHENYGNSSIFTTHVYKASRER
jgi:hypothetical protein